MPRLILPLLAALAIALTACSNDEETVTDQTTTPTPTTLAGDITICPHIGVIGEVFPTSPTPEPSCEPGDDFTDIAPNIRGRIAEAPPLPSGMIALTRYLEFTIDSADTGAVISMPLQVALPIGKTFAWYTYDSGQWTALRTTVQVHESTLSVVDAIAEGDFQPLPANLILLAEQ